jgi:hypothetical protein
MQLTQEAGIWPDYRKPIRKSNRVILSVHHRWFACNPDQN